MLQSDTASLYGSSLPDLLEQKVSVLEQMRLREQAHRELIP